MFSGEIFDPQDAVAVFEERLDEEDIGAMFSESVLPRPKIHARRRRHDIACRVRR